MFETLESLTSLFTSGLAQALSNLGAALSQAAIQQGSILYAPTEARVDVIRLIDDKTAERTKGMQVVQPGVEYILCQGYTAIRPADEEMIRARVKAEVMAELGGEILIDEDY